jgi:hypothetical protein
VPLVLCELEGRSRNEVAHSLGVPEGTLSWRLAQAKKLLGRRLSRYGTVAVGALFAEGASSARLSSALLKSTADVVLKGGMVPAQVMTLTQGVLKTMLLSKLKITFCAACLILLTGIGATGLTYRATAQQPGSGVTRESRPLADDLEALRLEIEALRKSLQATRERVRALEGEVSALKGQGARAPGGMMNMRGGGMRPMPAPGGPAGPSPETGRPRFQPGSRGNSAPAAEPGTQPSQDRRPGITTAEQPRGPAPRQPGSRGNDATAPEKGAQPLQRNQPESTTQEQPAGPAPETRRQPPQSSDRPVADTNGKRLPDRGRAASDPLADAEAALKKLRRDPGDTEAAEALERALQRLKVKERGTVDPSRRIPQ